jgi:hypothetical protein
VVRLSRILRDYDDAGVNQPEAALLGEAFLGAVVFGPDFSVPHQIDLPVCIPRASVF